MTPDGERVADVPRRRLRGLQRHRLHFARGHFRDDGAERRDPQADHGQRATPRALTEAARRNGMRNLREDGWMKIRDGVTTVEEVMRVTQEF